MMIHKLQEKNIILQNNIASQFLGVFTKDQFP